MRLNKLVQWTHVILAARLLMYLTVIFTVGVTGYKVSQVPIKQVGAQGLNITNVLYKDAVQLRLTLDNINKFALDGQEYYRDTLPEFNQQALLVMKHTDQAVSRLSQTQDDVHDLLVTSRQTIEDLQPIEQEAQQGVAHFDALVSDPNIKESIANIHDSTIHVDDATRYTEGITKDVSLVVHNSATHCTWFSRLFHLCIQKEK